MLTNPVFLSVALMLLLCALRFNVFLAILCSGLFAGIYSALAAAANVDAAAFLAALQKAMSDFIAGMSGNLETSLSYILVGALAAAVARTNFIKIFAAQIAARISTRRYLLLAAIAFFACFSQNLIPIHIAFIPILIPPLSALFARLQLSRRAIACAITFGITTPYVVLPLGFGLIFHSIIAREINKAGGSAQVQDIFASTYLIGLVMIFGLVLSMLIYGRKREQWGPLAAADAGADAAQIPAPETAAQTPAPETAAATAGESPLSAATASEKFSRKDFGVLAGLVTTIILQMLLKSLPLSALAGFLIIIATGGIRYKNLNEIFGEGFAIMGYVAFIMLVAAGFGAVLQNSGAIAPIVQAVAHASSNKFLISFGMMAVGLLITLGIGSSFGTVPIIAAIFVPICLQLGFSPQGIIFLIAAAGFIGDTGSPASEATLGVAIGINADGRGDHIRDVCMPTMLCYNLPLLAAGSIIPAIL